MSTAEIQALDKAHVWHPFTPMAEWCAPESEPLVLERGEGVWLFDTEGRRYFDGNSSIWTNIHGHRHPALTAAIREQLDRVAHVSFLGATHEPAARLAAELVALFPPDSLTRVFFSDDGSTAVECALRQAWQYWEWLGQPHRRTLIAFAHAYHGDTLGAASLGGIPVFAGTAGRLGLPVRHVHDADELEALNREEAGAVAAVIIEPLVQGAAGLRLWPPGLLCRLRDWCDRHGALLIFDEVMTGFGRTGRMFAGQHEAVTPDFLCLAKGLTGGYSPLAATLTTDRVFQAFVGPAAERRTFFYGHSYSGHALGCAAALASLRLFRDNRLLEQLAPKIFHLAAALENLRTRHPHLLREVRQCGFIAGVEIHPPPDPSQQPPATPPRRWGAEICLAARRFGLLTRPIGNTLILMPPLCTTIEELDFALAALESAMVHTLAPTPATGFQLRSDAPGTS
jgi:adenosylmethionine---8-amino-7-oxononanoate aminotransferase